MVADVLEGAWSGGRVFFLRNSKSDAPIANSGIRISSGETIRSGRDLSSRQKIWRNVFTAENLTWTEPRLMACAAALESLSLLLILLNHWTETYLASELDPSRSAN